MSLTNDLGGLRRFPRHLFPQILLALLELGHKLVLALSPSVS
jgi:hypothetical protein